MKGTSGWRTACPAREVGAVTAEVAVALPAVVALLAVVLAAATVGVTQLRIEEAARAGAREIMRGEPSETVGATVQRIAGDGAHIEVHAAGKASTVVVSTSVDLAGLDLIGFDLSAHAVATPEVP